MATTNRNKITDVRSTQSGSHTVRGFNGARIRGRLTEQMVTLTDAIHAHICGQHDPPEQGPMALPQVAGNESTQAMTTAQTPHAIALEEAVAGAVLAPSIHNTQPWRFRITDNTLEILLDGKRRLAVLDPGGRQQWLSVGCAVFNARVALAHANMGVVVTRTPDADRPYLAALLRLDDGAPIDSQEANLKDATLARHTNRRHFSAEQPSTELLAVLEQAAQTESAVLHLVTSPDDRGTLARLSQLADNQQLTNPAYRAELRSWTTIDPGRLDGVFAAVVPHVDGTAHDEIPIRDFDTRGAGFLPGQTEASSSQCLAVLATAGDGPQSWLQAGQALERVWLELTRAGFVASLFTQVIEEPGLRAQLRAELRLTTHPQVVLRIGRAPATPASRRRLVTEVLQHPHTDPCTAL